MRISQSESRQPNTINPTEVTVARTSAVKLGYSTWSAQTLPLTHALREAARAGYDAVEIAVNPGWSGDLDELDDPRRREIGRLLDDTGLGLASILSGHRDQLAEPGTFALGRDRFARELELARRWSRPGQTPVMNVTVGGTSERWEEQKELIVARMADTVRLAGDAGIVVAFEPQVGRAIDRPERMLWAIEQIGSPFCRVNFDLGHFAVQGLAAEQTASQLAPVTAHTHLPDFRGRYPDHEFAVPGEGEAEYVEFLRVMDARGYRGCLSVEISLMVQRRAEYDPIRAMQRAYETLSTAFDNAGVPRD